MNDQDKLREQIEKMLNPTGALAPRSAPNLTPVGGSEKEQHLPPKEKKALAGRLADAVKKFAPRVAQHLHKFEDHYDLAGLGVLAAPVADEMHEQSKEQDRRGMARSGAELGGLGVLGLAPAAKILAKHACIDELLKMGAISDEQARSSLDRLDTLERNKQTPKQVARYALVGGLGTPMISAVKNAITKSPQGGIRGVAANALGGALSAGALPLVQRHLDQAAEKQVLRQYLSEHAGE